MTLPQPPLPPSMPSAEPQVPRRRLPTLSATARRSGMLLAVLAGGAYLAFSLSLHPQQVQLGLERLGITGIAAILGLSLLNYLLRFLRWHWYLTRLGHRLPLMRHALIYLSGFALTVSPGKAGEALRGLYLRPWGVHYARSFAVLLVERLLDLLALALLASLLLRLLPGLGASVLVAIVLAGVIAYGAGARAPRRWLERFSRTPRRHLGLSRFTAELASMMGACAAVLKPQRLLPGIVLGLLSWGAEGLGLYLLLQALGFELSPDLAAGVFAAAALAGAALLFMPGGLGGAEAAMTALLVGFGASLPLALTATLLCRLATLWFAVFLGLIAVAALETWPGQTTASGEPP